MKTLLKKLTETAAPSGYESAVREMIRSEINSLSKDIKVDSLGNLIVTLGKKTDQGLKVMIDAHMDEIGFMVSHVAGALFQPRHTAAALSGGEQGALFERRARNRKLRPI